MREDGGVDDGGDDGDGDGEDSTYQPIPTRTNPYQPIPTHTIPYQLYLPFPTHSNIR